MSRSYKKVPIIKGQRHGTKNGARVEKHLYKKRLRRVLNREREFLMQGNLSLRVTAKEFFRYGYYSDPFDFRWYEKDKYLEYSPTDYRFDCRDHYDHHMRWLKKMKRHSYGK